MSSENDVEVDGDLEGVRFVRMEDVQPRDTDSEEIVPEEIETCIIDYDDCLVEDDDSNIGSMVSIKSEDVLEYEDNNELIVPDIVEPGSKSSVSKKTNPDYQQEENTSPKAGPDSWPTLEILPGGVINLADKNEGSNPINVDENEVTNTNDMMYACAKCSQSFKYLFVLVKHVKWHEDEAKKAKQSDLSKLKPPDECDYNEDNNYTPTGKRKRAPKPKIKTKKVPKKS